MSKSTFYCLLAALCLYVSVNAQDTLSVSGIITSSENGLPVDGAIISYKLQKNAISDAQGRFRINGLSAGSVLQISCVGYLPQSITVAKAGQLNIRLQASENELDEAIVLGYGKTSRRFNTGNVAKVSAAELTRMPISNPLNALAGRVTGVDISQTNGLPGATYNVLIRGQASLHNGTAPLYVIDGVPFMQNRTGNNLYTAMVPSPLNAINPADIESIEVLKDADATAIYGSQGANGVILITTKKALAGRTDLKVNYYSGWGTPTRQLTPMKTADYIGMRRQAFINDAVVPTSSTAPDLLVWDTTAYTNWQEVLTGGTARVNNIDLSIGGGNSTTRILLSGNYNGQSTVFPGSKPVQRLAGYINISHLSANGKFRLQLSSALSDFHIDGPFASLSSSVYLPPNTPAMYDSSGKLTWDGWSAVENPMAQLEKEYNSHTYVLNSNLQVDYRLLSFLSVKLSSGYNQQRQDEYRNSPIKALSPSASNRGMADWQNSKLNNWMLEPQLVYLHRFGELRTEIIGGISWQERKQEAMTMSGSNYTDDDLLGDPKAAGTLAVAYNSNQYRYMAYFVRASLQWKQRYLLSGNFRRDGSSRFSPDVRFDNFGSGAAAWIFSEENRIKDGLKFLTYGKLRGSYGVTGNDLVGDYAFLDSWSTPSTGNYQGNSTLAPNGFFNPYLQWERVKKLEFALELGFLKNRIMLSSAWYRNRCDNQLIGLLLPSQTGFGSINANRDALIENSGWELELTSKNFVHKQFSWTTSINATIPRSKLIRYPGLEKTVYRFTYAIGEPLDLLYGYQYTGVDAQTNTYQFEDINKDGIINSTGDYKIIGRLKPVVYGGMTNLFRLGNFELEILLQGVKQTGRSYLQTLATVPGNLGNQPAVLLNEEELQKYTSRTSGTVVTAYRNYQKSTALLTDASYIRLKNLSLTYNLSASWQQKLHMRQGAVYVQGQNLLTITQYKGADPETQSVLSLPPIKMLVIGVRVGF